MKKLSIYLGIIVALFGLLYFINHLSEKRYVEPAEQLYGTTPDKLNPATKSQLLDKNYQRIILPAELDEKRENKEDLFVYLFSPTCKYCQETTPILNEIAAEVGVDYYQLNVLEFQDQWLKYNIDGTPTLIYIKDGEPIDRIDAGISNTPGYTRADYKAFLEKYKAG